MYFKDGPLPSLSQDEQDALRMVVYDVEMAAEEYIVEDLERAICQVWEVALRIGVKHGQREARQAHTNPAKELEQERVWGFDVGWRLATEDCALKASKTSIPPLLFPLSAWAKDVPHHDLSPPSAPRASEHPIHPHSVSTSTQTELPFESSPAAGNEDLDAEVWYEAPELPPNPSLPSPSPTTTFTRDFSDLRTETLRPFASLQRRHRRAPRGSGPCLSTPRSSRAPQTRTPQTIVLNIYDSKPKTPRARNADAPLSIPALHSYPLAPPYDRGARLDWGHDPRLRDLSRALTALGWVQPGC
ncbi:hypothetical protein B0H13DRAFT_2566130 [Mycena leptocephala]|nr:hypothetical protein B0H13DRAFT_2566130 [Mycena leptocephala]